MQLLLSVLTLAHIITTGVSIRCYYCQDYEVDSQWHYDEGCGVDDYQGNINVCHDCDGCYVAMHTGDVTGVDRGGSVGHSDGDCVNSRCYCKGDLCNTFLCGECTTTPQPPPTNATTIATTPDVTTEPTDPTTTVATTPDVTTEPTEPTTTVATTPEVTTEPTEPTTLTTKATTTTLPPTTTPPHIECFDCQMDNQDWDNFDQNCNMPDYQGNTYDCVNCHSCYTRVLEDGTATRGEAGMFQDGQCLFGTDEQLGLNYVFCYCTDELCNTNLCEECNQADRMGNHTRGL